MNEDQVGPSQDVRPTAPTTLRVVSWNMDHWKRMRADPGGATQRAAWEYLLSLRPQIALVQEATPPPFVDPASWPVRSHPAFDRPDEWFIHEKYRRWGSAVVVLDPALVFEPLITAPLYPGQWRLKEALTISHPGTWAGIRLTLPDGGSMAIVSAYGVMDDYNPETKGGYATASVNRMLSDLTPLIDSEVGKRMIIGGDLNIGTQYVDPSPTEQHRWGPMNRWTMARFEAFDFSERVSAGVSEDRGPLARCPCGPAPDCRHVRTLRWDDKPDGVPWHNDAFWATQAVSVRSCAPVDDEAAWALSDHCPILTEVELLAAPEVQAAA